MSEYNVQDLIKNAIGEKPVAVQDVFDNLMVEKYVMRFPVKEWKSRMHL